MSSRSGSSFPAENPQDDPDVELVHRIVSILHQTRLQQKVTLRQLGERIRVDFSHLARAERRVTQPSLMILLRWSRSLDLDFENVLKEARKSLQK